MFLRPITRAHRLASRVGERAARHLADDRGQATAEYGLVILAAGGIALGVIAWAAQTGTFTDLFESVVDKLTDNL
jgi:Flp pilus assembly pilin Flp